jgi:hypothetical protein
MWAARVLGAKNSLVAADAKLLEDAFEQKFSGFSSPLVTEISADDRAARWRCRKDRKIPILEMGISPAGIDKSVLAIPHRVGTATGSVCATSLRSHASSAPQAVGPASSSAPTAARARPQGQRRKAAIRAFDTREARKRSQQFAPKLPVAMLIKDLEGLRMASALQSNERTKET